MEHSRLAAFEKDHGFGIRAGENVLAWPASEAFSNELKRSIKRTLYTLRREAKRWNLGDGLSTDAGAKEEPEDRPISLLRNGLRRLFANLTPVS